MISALRRYVFDRRKAARTTELVVKRRYPAYAKILFFGVIAAIVIGGSTYIYNYGLSMAGYERHTADRLNASLEDEIKKVSDENQDLREALARAQRTIQMDEAAYKELDQSLKAQAQEIVKLREELNFYRNIISPTDKKAGLRIQNLYIEPVGNTNKYRYKLVLIQALKHERAITGSARMEVIGTQGGQEMVLRYPEADRSFTVNLKYFQDIEGRIELPKNFKPRQVKVSVTTSSAEVVTQTYAWPPG